MSAQQNYDLLVFAVFPAVYTIGFFGWCYLAEKSPIFSSENSRSTSTAICGHVSVLLILIMLAEIANRIYPSLPAWLTDRMIPGKSSKSSIFELLCCAVVLAIGAIEKHWIYIDSGVFDAEMKDGKS